MTLLVYDDDRVDLRPMTDLRPTFAVRTGMLTTLDRIFLTRGEPLAALWVPERLLELTHETFDVPANEPPRGETVLCVNGRWLDPIGDDLPPGRAWVDEDGTVLAAHLKREAVEAFLRDGTIPRGVEPVPAESARVLRRPWDVIRHREATFAIDRDLLRPENTLADGLRVGENPVAIAADARVHPGVVFDAADGPIVIENGATVRPGAILCGPCFLGRGSTVIDRALIKPYTAIGPRCKVGGEVGGTIFQGYSNKSHDGHLGDSWIGEWVNFGAGTTNSNLLNTYGEVIARIDPDGPRERTGLTFLGSIVGDHTKFAIETRLMTGTVVGTGAMIASAAAPPTAVRSFAWITDEGERTYRLPKFLDVAETVMARRGIELTDAYRAALARLHARATEGSGGATRADRGRAAT